MNTIIDIAALKRLCLAIIHRAVKEKDNDFFQTELSEEVCSTVNLNRQAIVEKLAKGNKGKGTTDSLIKKYEKKPALVQGRVRGEGKQDGKRKN